MLREEFQQALVGNQPAFGVELAPATLDRLADYYETLNEHNAMLHLVAPCSPAEFASRHVLESLTMLKHLPPGSVFADVGSGGGLPALPCLIARDDLKARLIESKEKKADFLRLAVERLGMEERAEVVAKQFTETEPGPARFVCCRALDKFADRLARLVKWADGRSLLLFGGEQLGQTLQEKGIRAVPELMPLSERRYLFTATRRRDR